MLKVSVHTCSLHCRRFILTCFTKLQTFQFLNLVRFDLDPVENKPKSKFAGYLAPKRGILKLDKIESCEVRDSEERTPCDINLSMYGLTTTNDGSDGSSLSDAEDQDQVNNLLPIDNMFKLSEDLGMERKSTAKFGGGK